MLQARTCRNTLILVRLIRFRYKLLLILVAHPNVGLAVAQVAFVQRFTMGTVMETDNVLSEYEVGDCSGVWDNLENQVVYGLIGQDGDRLRVVSTNIYKSPDVQHEYCVVDNTMRDGVMRDLTGVINLQSVYKKEGIYLGSDNKLEGLGITAQGLLQGTYLLHEEREANSNAYSDKFYSKFEESEGNPFTADASQLIAVESMNNAFIGTWISFDSPVKLGATWGDWRVPESA